MTQPPATPLASATANASPARDHSAEIDALTKRLEDAKTKLEKLDTLYRHAGPVSFGIVVLAMVSVLVAGASMCVYYRIKDYDLWAFVAAYAVFASALIAVLCVFSKSVTDDY